MVKLSKANVLLVNVGGLGVEIAKNIVLAGVHSFTLIDNEVCQPRDLGCQFYVNKEHIANRTTRFVISIYLLMLKVKSLIFVGKCSGLRLLLINFES